MMLIVLIIPVHYDKPNLSRYILKKICKSLNKRNMKTTLPLLGNISVKEFLTTYWHKKPLLIRQAIPEFTPPITKKDLFSMAKHEDVESRFIEIEDERCQVSHGPFDKLPSTKKKNWTLLVQGVNLHHEEANALMEQFRFIPDTRLDDLMISYATDQGGVGPHFDSYDVFLLQAHGQRRWRISNQKDLSLIDGIPLKILKNFKYTEEFVLNPGDMLYLPPQYAHDGVALGECMTYSIGFRAPTYQELGEEFLHFMADSIELPGRYSDPKLKETKHPAEIQDDMLKQMAKIIASIQFGEEDMTLFLGRYLSEPKSNVFFNAEENTLDEEAFLLQLMNKVFNYRLNHAFYIKMIIYSLMAKMLRYQKMIMIYSLNLLIHTNCLANKFNMLLLIYLKHYFNGMLMAGLFVTCIKTDSNIN